MTSINLIMSRINQNLMNIITSYQDMNTIYKKLNNHGYIDRLLNIIVDIFEEEHDFTVSELEKYQQDYNSKNDLEFFNEQYLLNTNIFKRNFLIILQNLVEEISKSILEKLYANDTEMPNKQKDQNHPNKHLIDENHAKKFWIQAKLDFDKLKSSTQYELESTLEPIEESNSTQRTSVLENSENIINQVETGNSISSNNVEPLSTESKVSQGSNPIKQKEITENKPKTYKHYRQKSTNLPSETNLSNLTKSLRSTYSPTKKLILDTEGFLSPNAKYKSISHDVDLENHIKKTNPNLAIHQSSSTEKFSKPQNHVNESSVNSAFPKKPLKNSNRLFNETLENHSLNGSSISQSTKFSVITSSVVDPFILDSEFSYGQGPLFSRSKRILSNEDNKVPGPGSYAVDGGENIIRKKALNTAFSKSQRLTYFDQVIKDNADDPGHIYYPTKHFLAKQ